MSWMAEKFGLISYSRICFGVISVLSLSMLSLHSYDVSAASLTDCDMLAAHPDDEQRAEVEGVLFDSIDTVRAISACNEAISEFPETPRFLFQLGRALDAGGDTGGAIETYIQAAEAGHIQAALNLGFVYRDIFDASSGADLDAYVDMLHWQTYAADTLGGISAQHYLGASYLYAPAEFADVELGMEYLTKSAEAGYPFAQHLLGFEYYTGEFFPQDMELAGSWLLRAAKQDIAAAQFVLARFVLDDRLSIVSDEDAVSFLRRAAEQGYADAKGYLGELLVTGVRLEQDIPRGFELLEQAALEGVEYSREFLWGVYLPYYIQLVFTGTGTLYPKDMPTEIGPFYGKNSDDALRWAEELAAKDDPTALILLAPLYQVGGGYEEDIVKAFELYSRAAELGHSVAIEKVERLLEEHPDLFGTQFE